MLDLSNKKALYTIYYRKKKNGGKRIIHAPCNDLKAEQTLLKKRLEEDEWTSNLCHGFRKGSCSSNAAAVHVDRDWVLGLDIANFFPSIKKPMLHFLSDREKEIATLDGKVVQGSPCSPIISNIVLRHFDEELCESLDYHNISYSRYADDITMSGYGKPDVGDLIHKVRARLGGEGFRVRNDKIDYMYKNHSQKVLGITVNEKVSLDRKTRKNLRAAIHRGNVSDVEMGFLAYLKSVSPDQYERMMQYKVTCDAKRVAASVAQEECFLKGKPRSSIAAVPTSSETPF